MALQELLTKLRLAKTPGDVFGADGDVMSQYLAMARIAHPDKYTDASDKELADEAFRRLQAFKAMLDKKPVVITSKKRSFSVTARIGSGDVSDVYQADDGYVVKVAKTTSYNGMVQAEAKTLKTLQAKADDHPIRHFLPTLHDSFNIGKGRTGRSANVYEPTVHDKLYTLEQVKLKYPNGIDAADAAWMLNRLLTVLAFSHSFDVVHCGILPSHVMIDPVNHGLLLVGWTQASAPRATLQSVSAKYRSLYPPEVLAKKPMDQTMDIYMAAESINYIVNPGTVPSEVRSVLRSMLLRQDGRQPSAQEAKEDFGVALERVYGKPKFRSFQMV